MSLSTAGFRKWWLSFYHFLLYLAQGSHSTAGHGTDQNWTLTPLLSDCLSKSSVRDNLWHPQTRSLWTESVPAWDLYLVRITQLQVPTAQQSQHTYPGICLHLKLLSVSWKPFVPWSKHGIWSMVIHPIMRILAWCLSKSLLMDWWPSSNMRYLPKFWPWHI